MDSEKRKIKRKINDLPMCRYGSSCYRKNPEHINKFRHPNVDISEDDASKQKEMDIHSDSNFSANDESDKVKRRKNGMDVTDSNVSKKSPVHEVSSEKELVDKPGMEMKYVESVKDVLRNMPQDFFHFWDFSSSLNIAYPEEAFAELGLHLVGPFDLLTKKLPTDKIVNLHCHWRYYYDPPEFQTVIKRDGEELYHIGYFRDYPKELPSVLASNSAKLGPKLTVKGDNIFAAVNFELQDAIKKCQDKKKKEKFCAIQKKLEQYAKSKKYSIDIQTSKTKARSKKTVTKTFHGLGIVVPVKNDVGYRPLPDSDATVKAILKKIVSAPNEDKRLQEEENLDELITNVQFANDECDYGMGLELGIDLFCFGDPYFHSHILHLLPLAYELLKRPKYGEIVRAHLMNRKNSDDLDTLDS